jgi:hypothetical protein
MHPEAPTANRESEMTERRKVFLSELTSYGDPHFDNVDVEVFGEDELELWEEYQHTEREGWSPERVQHIEADLAEYQASHGDPDQQEFGAFLGNKIVLRAHSYSDRRAA